MYIDFGNGSCVAGIRNDSFPDNRNKRKEAGKCGKDKVYICTGEIGLYEKYGFEYIENRVDIWGEDSRLYVRTI